MGISLPLGFPPGAGPGAGENYPTEIADDFSADSGSWLDGDLAPAAITIDTGKGIWTPTYGAEKLTNPSWDAWSGGNPTGWTITAGAASADPGFTQVGTGEGNGGVGTGSINYLSSSTNSSPWLRQTGKATVGKMYLAEVVKSYGSGGVRLQSDSFNQYITNNQTYYIVWRATSTEINLRSGTAPVNDTVDLYSVKEITAAQQFRLRRVYYPSYVEAKIWLTNTVQRGVALYKDANNWIIAYRALIGGPSLDTRIRLLKCVAGTVSALLGNANVAYSAGDALRLAPNAAFNAFTVSYGGTPVLSDVAITDFASDVSGGEFGANWYAGLYNTHNMSNISTDAFDDFVASAVV